MLKPFLSEEADFVTIYLLIFFFKSSHCFLSFELQIKAVYKVEGDKGWMKN